MKTKPISQNTLCRCGVSKYVYNSILQIMILVCSLNLASCSEGDDGSSGSNIPQENKDMLGSKWSLVAWDYSLGDEYVGLHKETYQIYFNSLDRGFIYYGKKDWYSDEGSSTDRRVSHFKYIKKGNKITLSYICDTPVLPIYSLGISGNRISPKGNMEDLQFAKETISSDDKKWINTILGKTGSCMWFSDLVATLWIDGEGSMADYSSYSSTPWAKNDRTPNNVVINEGVTSIGACSFANVSIASVQMPDKSLKKVGDGAFSGSLITRTDLGDNVTYIGQEAFAGCEYLRYIDIPANIVTIGDWAFADCKKISATTLRFPKTLSSIGNYAFYNAGSGEIKFEEGIETIGNAAFLLFSAKNTELVLPNSLKSIGATAFEGKFSKITIGTGLEKMDKVAFISSASAGEIYVNRSTPPSANECIIGYTNTWSPMENKWTLYVPQGCKKVYQATSPWNKFKSIIEDETLSDNGDNGEDGDDNEGGENDGNQGTGSKKVITGNAETHSFYAVLQGEISENLGFVKVGFETGRDSNMSNVSGTVSTSISTPGSFELRTYGESFEMSNILPENTKYYYRAFVEIKGKKYYGDIRSFTSDLHRCPNNLTYMIDGDEYKMILVKDGPQGDFYIMQTELPLTSSIRIGDCWVPQLNIDNDEIVKKSEMRTFFNKLYELTGIEFRMPTKDEWIYAAQGGHLSSKYIYSGSNNIDDVAWYNGNSGKRVHPFAQKTPNELGLYDMSGNYAEVTNECSDYRMSDFFDTDGYICGGSWERNANDCKATSVRPGLTYGNVVGTRYKELNAFDARRNTIRLVYSKKRN